MFQLKRKLSCNCIRGIDHGINNLKRNEFLVNWNKPQVRRIVYNTNYWQMICTFKTIWLIINIYSAVINLLKNYLLRANCVTIIGSALSPSAPLLNLRYPFFLQLYRSSSILSNGECYVYMLWEQITFSYKYQ